MSSPCDENDDSNDNDDDFAARERPSHPLHIDDDDDAVEESTAMLSNINMRHDSDSDKASSPRAQARSMDQFLEEAYREHSSSSCWRQWHYTLLMLSLGVANSSDASEILCISYILSNHVFQQDMLSDANDNDSDNDWRGGLLAASVFAGMLLGGLLVGTLGDWRGRRPMLLTGLILNMTAGLLSAAAPNVVLLAALRFFAGCGIGATVPPLFTLVAELAPPSRRGFYVTLCASFWMVGSIFVALAGILILQRDEEYRHDNVVDTTTKTIGIAAWRLLALVCAIPSAVGALLVYVLVPESPRFLAMQGNIASALISTNSLSASLAYSGPPWQRWEIEEHYNSATCLSLAHRHPTSLEHNDNDDLEHLQLPPVTTWRFLQLALVDFCISAGKLYTPQVVRITLALQMAWFSLSFGSYGLMTWINLLFFEVHLEDVYFNALLFSLSNLPGNLLTAYLMDRTGRSSLLVGSILSASASLLSFALFASSSGETSTSAPNKYGIVLSACSFQCFTIAAWNTIDVITSESFPTTVRSTGMGVCAASGRIGACIAQFINGALVGRPVRLLVVASITLALGAITPFLLPSRGDMTGRPVQDDFDLNHIESSSLTGVQAVNCIDGGDQLKPASQSHLTPSGGLSRRAGNHSTVNSPTSYQRLGVSAKDNSTVV